MPSGPFAFFISNFWQILLIVVSDTSKSSTVFTSAVRGKTVLVLEVIKVEAKFSENNSDCVKGSFSYSSLRNIDDGVFDFLNDL